VGGSVISWRHGNIFEERKEPVLDFPLGWLPYLFPFGAASDRPVVIQRRCARAVFIPAGLKFTLPG